MGSGRRFHRLVLVEPRSSRFQIFHFVRLPRLGLPILGTLLRRRGFEVTIFCEDLAPLDWEEVAKADAVLISTITCTAPRAYEIARFCAERNIPTIMGGPHVTFLPEEALRYCSWAVRGEGEETTLELLEALQMGEAPEGILGVSLRDGDAIVHNPPRPFLQDLDSLPFPDLSLLRGSERLSATPLLTSRGCPYQCTFCSVIQMFGRGFRRRSVASVMEEIRRQRPRVAFFYDDIFNADTERMANLLEAMLREGLVFPWSAQCHTHLLLRQRDLLPLMRRSGCYALYLGFESINPATLAEYNKRQTVEEIREAIHLLHRHGILVHGMFVLGADSDELATLWETVRFALRHRIDTAQFLILTPVPGTPLYRSLEAQGRLLIRNWECYDGHHVVFRPARMSPMLLQIAAAKAMQTFYSLGSLAFYILALRDWLRDLTRPFFLSLQGRFQEALHQLFRTREVIGAKMRLCGWWWLRRFLPWQIRFARWLAEHPWN